MPSLHCLTLEIPSSHVGLGPIPSSLSSPSLVTVKYSCYISLREQGWSLLAHIPERKRCAETKALPMKALRGEWCPLILKLKNPESQWAPPWSTYLAPMLRCPISSVLKASHCFVSSFTLFTTIFTSPRTGSLGKSKGLHHIDSDDHIAGTWVRHFSWSNSGQVPLGAERNKRKEVQVRSLLVSA